MSEQFRAIKPEEIKANMFDEIGKQWMLIGAQNPANGEVNMMTASWGGTGIMWGKPVAFIFIRPQRFTREYVDATETFSLTFFSEDYRKQLALCGAKSGRDIDKVKECGFDVAFSGVTPYFEQAKTAFICHKLYRQQLDKECFMYDIINDTHYPQNDHHYMYVAEITEVLVKD